MHGGPGSDYRFTYSGSQVRLRNLTTGLDAEANFSELSTGFNRWTISSVANDGGQGIAVSDVLYAVRVKGLFTTLRPLSGNQLVLGVSLSTCPTANRSLRFINTRVQNASSDYLFGSWIYNPTTLGITYSGFLGSNLTTTADLTQSFIGTCSGGLFTMTGGKSYVSASGGGITQIDFAAGTTDDQYYAAMPFSSVVASGDFDGTYSGFYTSNLGTVKHPIQAVISGSTMTIDSVDALTGSADSVLSSSITFSSFSSNGLGSWRGVISSGSEPVRCFGGSNFSPSKKYVFCAGQASGGAASDRFSLITVLR